MKLMTLSSALILGATVTSVNAASFTPIPLLAEEGVQALNRTVARDLVDRELFGTPYATAIVGNVDVYDRFPYLEARYFQIVSDPAWEEAVRTIILLMAPITPHLSEELWERVGGTYSVHTQSWPEWDEELARPDMIEMPVQINGKVRAKFEVEMDGAQVVQNLSSLGMITAAYQFPDLQCSFKDRDRFFGGRQFIKPGGKRFQTSRH